MLHTPTGGQQVTPRPFWGTREAEPALLESKTTHLQVLREEGPQLRLQQLPVGGGERRMRPHGAGWGRQGPELGAARAELTANVRGGRICVTPCRRGLGWPHTSVVRGRGSRFIVPPSPFHTRGS